MRQWVDLESRKQKPANVSERYVNHLPLDPVTWSIEQCNSIRNDIGDKEDKSHLVQYQKLVNDVTSAYKGMFDIIMKEMKNEFQHSLLQLESVRFPTNNDWNKEHNQPQPPNQSQDLEGSYHDTWNLKLNQAVKDGTPADFSSCSANRIYALEKLLPRVRYLYYLVMDYNPISNRIRALFLPSHIKEGTKRNDEGIDEHINVCSIGGGPGYDHISLKILSLLLQNMQGFEVFNYIKLQQLTEKNLCSTRW